MRTWRLGIGIFLFMAAAAALAWLGPWELPTAATPTPDGVFPQRTSGGFVGSAACVECHRDQHSSWEQSYHHTMTQLASPATVLAPFEDTRLTTAGTTARLQRRGDEFWVTMNDPRWENEQFANWTPGTEDASAGSDADAGTLVETNVGADDLDNTAPQIESQVVMVTGSHHFQVYWVQGEPGREMWQLPWRYHLGQRRWVHRRDVFLAPPQWHPGMWFRVWNDQCSLCHSTGPWPGRDPASGVLDGTEVAELGISCESCHGPGQRHVALNEQQTNVEPAAQAASIVNPQRLSHQRGSEVCGQCHSHFEHRDPQLTLHGPQFRPGDNLYRYGNLVDPSHEPGVMSRYWTDGTNRSGGREFNGLSASACFQDGQMTCFHCHSLHDSQPNDQLSTAGLQGDACLECHQRFRDTDTLVQHTHHAADSTGSQCYNCHMPHTNYALFKAIRSHQVDSPRVTSITSNSRPNACNLCHLDQTLDWTNQHLAQWYQRPAVPLAEDERDTAAGVLWALRGDAGQRVIAAWHLGWDAAQQAAGKNWSVPLLAELLQDPYAAVRWVAWESLRTHEPLGDLEYDFDGTPQHRRAAAAELLQRWQQTTDAASLPPSNADSKRLRRLLLESAGRIDESRWAEILQRRDKRLVAGVE